jgi:aminopeptidase N
VTPAWWTHLWLNEGFASWMQYHAIDQLFPSWNIWLDFARGEMSDALTADSDHHTHAIAVPHVEDPRLIDNLFDDVTYAKAAAVIRMVAQAMGAQAFQRAIRLYLKRFLFGSATTADLCQALDDVAGSEAGIGKMMTQWVEQRGYPVLQFRLSSQAEGNNTATATSLAPTNTQPDSLFGARNALHLYVDQHSSVADASAVWRTPVTLTVGFDDGTSSTTRVTLSTQTSRINLQPKKPIAWIIFNADRASFLRVLYTDPVLSGNVQEALDAGHLSDDSLARWILQDDAFALCRLGALPPHDVVDLWMHLAADPDPVVGSAIVRALGRLRLLLGPKSVGAFLNSWGSVQWKERLNVGKQVSHPAELHLSIFQPVETVRGLGAMRGALVHQLGMCGDATVLAQLAPHFRRWKQRVASGFMSPIQLDLAAARMAVRYNTDGGWEAIAQLKRDYPDCLSTSTYWMLACYSQDAQVLRSVLTQLLLLPADDPKRDIALQDISYYMHTLCHSSAESVAVAARFLAEHWDTTITKRFADPFAMKSLLDAFDLLADKDLARELPDQLHAPTPDLANLVAQLLAVQRDNLEWLEFAGADFMRELSSD